METFLMSNLSDLCHFSTKVSQNFLLKTGSFVCTVTSKANKTSMSAKLSVLDVENCRTFFVDDILGHKCRVLSSGYNNYTIYWNCAFEAVENITSSFYAIKNILSEYVKVQVASF